MLLRSNPGNGGRPQSAAPSRRADSAPHDDAAPDVKCYRERPWTA